MFLLKSTKLRRKLLAFAFAHPGESHYVRELAAHISEDPGNLSRELKALEEEGLFSSQCRGNLKLYSLNKDYPLYDELKKMMAKTEGIEGSLKQLFAEFSGVRKAFVYGSYAKNKEKKLSDVDVVIVGKVDEDELAERIRGLETRFNREINYTSYTEQEFDREKGKQGGFLELVLKEKIIELKGRVYDR